MATITAMASLVSDSKAIIDTNFSNLNTAKVDGATALTTAGRLVEVASSGVATQTSFASSVVVLTSGSYADPAWVTSLATTKLTGTLQATQFPALTGDVTTSAGAVATTLANTAVTPASYGSATQVATFTVDSKGRLTAAASTSIAIAASQVTSGTLDNARTTAASTNTVSAIVARDASGNFAAGTITATFSGNLTGNVTGNVSGTAATITGALALANTPLTTRGDLLVATTATPILGRLAKGTQYQVLTGGATDPTWGAVDLSQATAITGTLPVGNGGTGATTLAGAGIVVGSASLTTANAIPIVASAGVLGQSDVMLASGIFSRAGTLGLSATGSNVITFSVAGSEHGRFSANGNYMLGRTTDGSSKLQVDADSGIRIYSSTSGYSLRLNYAYSTTIPSIYALDAGGSLAALSLQTGGGNVLIGTTTDDGASKLQVAGNLATSGGSGGLLFNSRDSGSAWLWYATSGGMALYNATGAADFLVMNNAGALTLYNPVAVTGVTSLVVRAGAGQSTTALQTWQNNAGTSVASVASTGQMFSAVGFLGLNTGAATSVALDSGTGSNYYETGLVMRHGSANRWYLVKPNNAAGNLELWRFNDAGSLLGIPFSITRADGYVSIAESGARVGFFGVTPAARAAALTAADASALTSSDATVIGNMRTRVGEIATALQNLGLIN